MSDFASDTFTFLFTDIEASTRKWEDASEAMRAALEAHDTIIRRAVEEHAGRVFKHTGDGCCAVFASASSAVQAAADLQRTIAGQDWGTLGTIRVRVAMHTGEAQERDGDFFGPTLNRVARLMSAGHGGQVLLSRIGAELARDGLPPGLELIDLGEHRLRDLSVAEQIFQLSGDGLQREFPSLRTLGVTAHNLPVQTTSLIGREDELARLADLLAEQRLLTLTGVGGVGKTRLALQLAAGSAADFSHGAWLIELATVRDRREVDRVVGSAAGAPAPLTRDSLLDFFHGKRCLLLLDNCEHLIDACADVASAILSSCPEVRIVATSREALGVPGEQTFPVPSLSLPPEDASDLASVQASAAIHLLVERARAARPDFALSDKTARDLAEIVTRLDGIPLAIELAAARLRAMSPAELLDRLHDRFRVLTGSRRGSLERHQTLRAAIDWSYDLLDEPAQKVAMRLAVFTGGWTLEAAEEVCPGGDVDRLDVFDILTELVDKSLVQIDASDQDAPTRYRFLGTVRVYLAEKLQAAGEKTATEQRHLDWVVMLADAIPANRWHLEPAHVLLVQRELSNITAALERALEDRKVDAAARIAGNCGQWAFLSTGAYDQGLRLVQGALELGGGNDLDRFNMSADMALIYEWRGAIGTALEWTNRSAALVRASAVLTGLDEATVLATQTQYSDEQREELEARSLELVAAEPAAPEAVYVHFVCGFNATLVGSPETALRELEDVWRRHRERMIMPIAAFVPQTYALARWLVLGEAADEAQEAVVGARAFGDPGALVHALSCQAMIDEQRRLAALHEARDLLRHVRQSGFAYHFFGAAARLAVGLGDERRAIRLIGAGRQWADVSERLVAGWEQRATGNLLSSYPQEERDALIAEGGALVLDEALDLALPDEGQ